MYKLDLNAAGSATSMSALICGAPTVCDPDPEVPCDTLNACSVDGISSPDNLSYLPEVRAAQRSAALFVDVI